MLWRIIFTVTMTAALACAQEGGGGGSGIGSDRMDSNMGRGGGNAGGGMRTPRQTPFDKFADKLKLNKDRRPRPEPSSPTPARRLPPAGSNCSRPGRIWPVYTSTAMQPTKRKRSSSNTLR